MEQRLQLADIAAGLVRRNNMPVKEAELFVRQFFECIGDNLFLDHIVKVKGLGTFKVVDVEPRDSVDVNSGQRITIGGHAKVSFTPDPVLRDAVNKPFAEFETVVLNENTPLEAMEAMDLNEEKPQTETSEEPQMVTVGEPVCVSEVPVEQQPEVAAEEEQVPAVTEEEAQQAPEVLADEEKQEEQPTEEEQQPEEVAPQENQLEEDVSPSEQIEEHIVQDNPDISDMLIDEQFEAEPSANPHRSLGFWHVLFPVLMSLIFFMVGYVVGYERPVSMPEWQQFFSSKQETVSQSQPDQPATKHVDQSVSKTEPSAVTTPNTTADSSAVRQKQHVSKQPSEVLAYPQVEDGDYYIVGIKGTEVMAPGKTLLNISIKYYQSKDFVNYICRMNNINNPDVVPLNMELKIPELKHK